MVQRIHAHEVMQMMMDSGVSYSKESLAQEMTAKYGSQARFFTCSMENMTAPELIDFLEVLGKFVPKGQGFSTDKSKLCSH
ncbi:MAG: YecH family protein [Candidatus Omnitrophica bacterium]|nr:YecH family protein [Candidatus Omnitrophota bacterium]